MFGLRHVFDSLSWWRSVSVCLTFGGLLIFGLALILDWAIWTFLRHERFIIGRAMRHNLKKMIYALILLCTAFIFFDLFSVLPVGYYRNAEKFVSQNFHVPVQKNVEDLTYFLSQIPLREYELDKFDCSESSAFVEWLCEGAGFHALIATGYARDPYLGIPQRHAWVVVKLPCGDMVPIEATTLTIPSRSDKFAPYYDPPSIYETPDDLIKGEYLLSEFDWWTVPPFDKMGAFESWRLIPPAIWNLIELPDRLTGYRVTSSLLLILICGFVDFLTVRLFRWIVRRLRLLETVSRRITRRYRHESWMKFRRGQRLHSPDYSHQETRGEKPSREGGEKY
jgi:hypothetical protein